MKYCSECGQELPTPKATHIVAILDMSGSMHPQWDEVISSYNAFIKEQKKLKEEAYVSLIFFDTVLEHPYTHRNLQEVGKLTKKEYEPRGMTALFDALNYGIKEFKTTKSEKTLFVIITDGYENASREIRDRAAVKDMIEKARSKGMEFVFLAADEEVFAQGINLGIPVNNVFNYRDVGYGGGTQVMSAGLSSYRTSNVVNTDNFFDPNEGSKTVEDTSTSKDL